MAHFIDENTIENRAFINGEYIFPKEGSMISKISSYTGQPLKGIANCSVAEVELAVDAAQKAFKSGIWSRKTYSERKDIILSFAALLEKNKDILARLDTYETCRAYRNYLYDSIPKAIEATKYFKYLKCIFSLKSSPYLLTKVYFTKISISKRTQQAIEYIK